MRRGTARKRRPTEADLTDSQRRIYDALADELKEGFLNELPLISTSNAGGEKKAKLIQERIDLVDGILRGFQAHRRHLEQLHKSLKQGRNPGAVDLRQELKPPAVEGVSIRFVRGRRGEEEQPVQ